MKNFKRYLLFFISLIFFGFGISLTLKSGLGNDPMGVFVQGIAKLTLLSFGTCNMIVALCETGIGYIFEKKNISIVTFIVVFCGSYSIDLAGMLIPETNTLIIRILYMVLGILSYCLCFAIQQIAKVGLSNYDCFIFGLAKLFKTDNYPLIRGCSDFFFIVTGLLLGGVVGVGTIILVLCSGKIIIFYKNNLSKIIKF